MRSAPSVDGEAAPISTREVVVGGGMPSGVVAIEGKPSIAPDSLLGGRAVVEPEPTVASELFGARLDVARQFAADLVEHGDTLGLIGPQELGRLWTRHLLNSALVAPLMWEGARVADIGSGAGLPGLVLAIARPDVTMYLIEPMERRTDWLRAEAERLQLGNVVVVRARAEDARLGFAVDQATARAVSALSKLLPIAVPLVRSGGQLLLMKGQRVGEEVVAARKIINKLRLTDIDVLEIGAEVLGDVTRVFRATVD